jgi:hypothetical protein
MAKAKKAKKAAHPARGAAKLKLRKAAAKPAVRSSPAVRSAPRAPSAAATVRATPKLSWLDEQAQVPVIDRAARQLDSFVAALADGVVEENEVAAQERRLVKLMREVEPQLKGELHGLVTRLLAELTAYDIMRILHEMHAARPKTAFRG